MSKIIQIPEPINNREIRVTRLTVVAKDEPIDSESATHIEIQDLGAGEFITITQVLRDSSINGIALNDRSEWESIKESVEILFDFI